jgi:hypothetical protein
MGDFPADGERVVLGELLLALSAVDTAAGSSSGAAAKTKQSFLLGRKIRGFGVVGMGLTVCCPACFSRLERADCPWEGSHAARLAEEERVCLEGRYGCESAS